MQDPKLRLVTVTATDLKGDRREITILVPVLYQGHVTRIISLPVTRRLVTPTPRSRYGGPTVGPLKGRTCRVSETETFRS